MRKILNSQFLILIRSKTWTFGSRRNNGKVASIIKDICRLTTRNAQRTRPNTNHLLWRRWLCTTRQDNGSSIGTGQTDSHYSSWIWTSRWRCHLSLQPGNWFGNSRSWVHFTSSSHDYEQDNLTLKLTFSSLSISMILGSSVAYLFHFWMIFWDTYW